jgi:hypothetical protein
MEALQDEKTRDEDEVYFNFINSLKSEITKETYQLNIKLFMNYGSVTKMSDLLVIMEPQKQIMKKLGLNEDQTNMIFAMFSSFLVYGIFHVLQGCQFQFGLD